MSDLQIALGVIGILAVGGVYAFNLWQERKLRQRLERAFSGEHEDVLLRSAEVPASARIEPQLLADQAAARMASGAAHPQEAAAVKDDGGADRITELVVDIELPAPASDAAAQELLKLVAISGKPARVFGRDARSGLWQQLLRGAPAECLHLQAGLQLADRSGAVSAPQLSTFCDVIREWAARQGATVKIDDAAAAVAAARKLDAWCGEVDVTIGLNVVAASGAAFSGDQIAAAAAKAGGEPAADDRFYWRDAAGLTLFTLENLESGALTADQLAGVQTSGLTLLLDVPRVADCATAFDLMVRAGQDMAETLGGFLVDDNRVPLQPAAVGRIKLQLDQIVMTMTAGGIPAGSPRAQRLFA